ncbi:hypothetical protein OH738_33935 [Streptomyces hirsutus]|uniref:Uncharacterized protein n=1 Tax=Streptomyces hirsutus TaxID=35620 RepID=A0ABZ1GZX7_9ACTN|nr:hypothetical protein [Streptomyces hirsutus]WSD11715.1 hypothetical protein OIE73_05715 [Streptomyces hirsutus]WTD22858.1 hypothetical protein OH738_33935 [Streptomyces hirsutus]
MLGELVVPTTIGFPSPEASDVSTPQPVAKDDIDAMDAMAATPRRHRFRLNTRTLLDLPSQESADDTSVFRSRTLLRALVEINSL